MKLNVHLYKEVEVRRNGKSFTGRQPMAEPVMVCDVPLNAVQEAAVAGLTSVAVTEPNENKVQAIRFFIGNFVFPMTMTMPRRVVETRTMGGPWLAAQPRMKRIEGDRVFLRESTKEDREAGRPYAHQDNHGYYIDDVIASSADPSLQSFFEDTLLLIADKVIDDLKAMNSKPRATGARRPKAVRDEEVLA